MNEEQLNKILSVPEHPVDVVLDTDAGNETDDLYAIAYLLRSNDKLNTKAFYAAPYFNKRSTSPENGMEKSYDDIFNIIKLCGGSSAEVFKGSRTYLPNETTFVDSPAARDLVERAKKYSPNNPLYVIAIGAITNIASAILMDSSICENICLIWLGGNGHDYKYNMEFNIKQDIAASRVVMSSNVPFVQLPAYGVITDFSISKPELLQWLVGTNPLADYLANRTITMMDKIYGERNKYWTHIICDVCAIAWLLNEKDKYMLSRIENVRLCDYDLYYEEPIDKKMRYIYFVDRDNLMKDLIDKLLK